MKQVKYKDAEIQEFLLESNAIEGVYGLEDLEDAKKAWRYLAKQKVLTTEVVLNVHKILMKNQPIPEKDKGAFRTCKVYIGGREGLEWSEIPTAIESWLSDVKTSIDIPGEDGEYIKFDHIEFERIHPWIDGNGRTGRMFMNWQRMKAGLPILIIHADWPDIQGEQRSYYAWFRTKE